MTVTPHTLWVKSDASLSMTSTFRSPPMGMSCAHAYILDTTVNAMHFITGVTLCTVLHTYGVPVYVLRIYTHVHVHIYYQ